MQENLISKAIELTGLIPLANMCGVTPQALYKWEAKGRVPRTDWTGETDYARCIETATKGQITRDQLLNLKRNDESGVSKPQPNSLEGGHA